MYVYRLYVYIIYLYTDLYNDWKYTPVYMCIYLYFGKYLQYLDTLNMYAIVYTTALYI